MKKLNKMCQYFHSTELYSCPKCGIELRNFMQEIRDKVKLVPIELKQKILDVLKEGKNIGQAIEIVDPDKKYESIIWFNVISDQIEEHRYQTFNYKAKK